MVLTRPLVQILETLCIIALKNLLFESNWETFRHLSDFDPRNIRTIYSCAQPILKNPALRNIFDSELERFDSHWTKRFSSRESVPTVDVFGTASVAVKKWISAREKE